MKIRRSLALIALALCALLATLNGMAGESDAVAEVKTLVEKAYVHGAFNELNPDAMAHGFHPDFAIYSPDGENIRKYPIADWVAGTRKRKTAPEFDAAKNVWEHRFVEVDVTGNAAAVKIELSKDGELVYTDYLSLLRFESGWRIVAKVYHGHRP
jgi:hypothetical protein